jgi:hypothetical protein
LIIWIVFDPPRGHLIHQRPSLRLIATVRFVGSFSDLHPA